MNTRTLRYTIVFLLLSAVCCYYGILLGWPWLALALNLSFCWAGVAMAYLLNKPGILGKTPEGTIALHGWIIFWPYILLSMAILYAYVRFSTEPAITRILESLYLGRRLSPDESRRDLPENVCGVVDLTAEFSEPAALRCKNYLYCPTLDTLNPNVKELSNVVTFIEQQMQQGSVYIHCALGHGRSATVVAAFLMYREKLTPDEAIEKVKRCRNKIGLHREQHAVLISYSKYLGGAETT